MGRELGRLGELSDHDVRLLSGGERGARLGGSVPDHTVV